MRSGDSRLAAGPEEALDSRLAPALVRDSARLFKLSIDQMDNFTEAIPYIAAKGRLHIDVDPQLLDQDAGELPVSQKCGVIFRTRHRNDL
jgi:hypothetical protein